MEIDVAKLGLQDVESLELIYREKILGADGSLVALSLRIKKLVGSQEWALISPPSSSLLISASSPGASTYLFTSAFPRRVHFSSSFAFALSHRAYLSLLGFVPSRLVLVNV